MLTEVKSARQIKGEPFRRWFSDEEFDLIVWYGDDRQITGFQLCYQAAREEKALTWLKGRGYFHNRVDDGETAPSHHKMTPILVADGTFDRDHVLNRFLEAANDIDRAVVSAVVNHLRDYPGMQQERAKKG
jgi:hypothetical protein